MLIIRKKQMDTFDNYMNDKFVKNLASHIIYDFPVECKKYCLNENNIELLIQNWLKKANKLYSLEYKDDLTFFIECNVLFSPDFDQDEHYQWARDILLDNNLNGSEKMSEINEYMLFCLEDPL